MRFKTTLAALAIIFVASLNGAQAHAESATTTSDDKTSTDSQPATDNEKKEVKVTVAPGDSLSSIAEAHGTTWVRLFNANASIANPDVINPGDELRIPAEDEQLEDRYTAIAQAAPAAPSVANASAPATAPAASSARVAAPQTTSVANAGNRYTWGTCTWYVFNRKPNIGSFWGNAGNWLNSARNAGFATGSTPVPGAIGVQGNHVVVVESVNGGTVSISEMNYGGGVGVVHYRTVPSSSFQYIYA